MMRTWLVLALIWSAGVETQRLVAQTDQNYVFNRICNVEVGQNDAAIAFAQEMVALISRKYPSAKMIVRTGRWMTRFQRLDLPVDQILFSEQHESLADRETFSDVLLDDDEFQDIQRKARSVIDAGSCVETEFRGRL